MAAMVHGRKPELGEPNARTVAPALPGQVGSVSPERDLRHSVNTQAVYR
jgi:hypothetical protein